MPIRIMIVFGTRPEAIKMVPVIRALKNEENVELTLCATHQHLSMFAQVLELFGIEVDSSLDAGPAGLSLAQSQARMLKGVDEIMGLKKPDAVLVHGDTSSCLTGALAAFYRQIPVVHIEAGLRTGNLYAPFPEEAHRQMVARIANLHFVPTERAAQNLRAENIQADAIHVTGNTIVDTLLLVQDWLQHHPDAVFRERLGQYPGMTNMRFTNPFVLVTLHRRESMGEKFRELCNGLKVVANAHPRRSFIFPLHLNPDIQTPATQMLAGIPVVHLIPPQDYLTFVWLMLKAELVVTDSGGVQEEAEILGRPLLIVRDHCDRPESLERDGANLVGTEASALIESMNLRLGDLNGSASASSSATTLSSSVYGDGRAAQRIVSIIKKTFVVETFVDQQVEYAAHY